MVYLSSEDIIAEAYILNRASFLAKLNSMFWLHWPLCLVIKLTTATKESIASTSSTYKGFGPHKHHKGSNLDCASYVKMKKIQQGRQKEIDKINKTNVVKALAFLLAQLVSVSLSYSLTCDKLFTLSQFFWP